MADGLKKIYIDQNETPAAVIKKIVKSRESEIVLYVPRGAAVTKSIKYFNELKIGAEKAHKKIRIESVDREALELAALAGLASQNSFFKSKIRPVVDIVPVDSSIDSPKKIEIRFDAPAAKSPEANEAKALDSTLDSEPDLDEALPVKKKKSPAFALFLLTLILAGGALAYFYLPRAEIDLTFNKTSWNFVGELKAQTDQKQLGVSGEVASVPAREISLTKSLTQVYPASGNNYVSARATGVITVYNDYSSQSQELIKTTRFISPDGHIFRTDQTIIVPGAKMVNGKLTPASVDVAVTADAPGADYNIGPVSRFTIPGFKGSPKYDGFYGVSSKAMTGGFVGQAKVPTKADISSAVSKTEGVLTQDLETEAALELVSGEKMLSGAGTSTATKANWTSVADNSGNFAVTVSETYDALVFKESDVLSAFASEVANQSKTDLSMSDYSLNYGTAQTDSKHGALTVPIDFKSNWLPSFDVAGFRNKIMGDNESNLRTAIIAIPDLEKSSIKLWPFWVTKVPPDPSKIEVVVN